MIFPSQDSAVVSVDGYMPVVDVLSNARCGILQCLLAVGSHSQLTALLASKNMPSVEPAAQNTPAEKPEESLVVSAAKTRHILHITVQTLQEIDMFEGSSWGQTDCFVTFSLPSSSSSSSPETKHFSSSTCNTAPHMKFNHRSTACLLLPSSTSLQHFLSRNLVSILRKVISRSHQYHI